MKLQKEDIPKIRIYKSGLIKPFAGAKECASAMFGIQAQAQQFGEINILNRVKNISRGDFEKFYEKKEIIKIWAQKVTVHMFAKEDWGKACAVYSPRENLVTKGWGKHRAALDKILNEIDRDARKKPLEKKDINRIAEKYAKDLNFEFVNYSVISKAAAGTWRYEIKRQKNKF